MKIKDLPEDIRKRALANQVMQGNPENPELELNATPQQGNFLWSTSCEGEDYWYFINNPPIKVSRPIPDEIYVKLGLAKSGNRELDALILEAEERDLVKRVLIAGGRPENVLRKFRDFYGISNGKSD